MNDNITIYKGYTIERLPLVIKYGKATKHIISFCITKDNGKERYFYRTKRLESFKTLNSAKSAIKDNRLYVCGVMAL